MSLQAVWKELLLLVNMKNKKIDKTEAQEQLKRPLVCFMDNEFKGISPILSHSLFIALGIVLLIFLSTLVWFIYTESVKQAIKNELRQVSQILGDEIIRLYSLKSSLQPEPNSSILLGTSSLQLPDKAGGRSYSLTLYEMSPAWIYVTNFTAGESSIPAKETRPYARIVARAGEIEAEYFLYNLEIKMQGSDDGGAAILEYYRYNFNGTVEDKITLGQPKILIAIEGIK